MSPFVASFALIFAQTRVYWQEIDEPQAKRIEATEDGEHI